LVDFRERIRVNGRWPDETRLSERLDFIRNLADGSERTFFEVCTALGFDDFAARQVEWAVIEVGLGGRLDTTNVLSPAVSVITSVGLDHSDMLGTTLAAIATEKAGIIKPGVPVISGARKPKARAVIATVAQTRGAPCIDVTSTVRLHRIECTAENTGLRLTAAPWGELELRLALRGRHQAENAVNAVATLAVLASAGVEIDAEALRAGCASVRWPGRLEPCPNESRLWWDGAHNADGIRRLAGAWFRDLRFPVPGTIVLAVSRDKNVAAMLEALRVFAPLPRLLVTRSHNERALAPEVLQAHGAACGWRAEVMPDVSSAVGRALESADGKRVLLTGSLFAVGEAMAVLGGAPGEML
jgi:dihydrofolate synthase/folylpolyglutamate synthase